MTHNGGVQARCPPSPLNPAALRERHEVFGDVKKLVTEEFVRQK